MNQYPKYILSVALLLFCAPILAQIETSRSLELTGSSGNKKVQGLALPQSANEAANAEFILKNIAHFASANGTSNYSITVQPSLTTYVPGLSLYFKIPTSNTGAVTLNIGNLGAKPLYRDLNKPLTGGELIQDHIVSVVYDGSAFHIVSPLITPCPTGYVAVNNTYCIEQNERPASTFFSAVVDCQDDNARLCSWGEWYFACTQAGALGLANMVNNYEWVNDAADEVDHVRVIGNNGSCTQIDRQNGATISNWSRCCFSR